MRSRSSCRPRCRPRRSSDSRNASGSGRWPRSESFLEPRSVAVIGASRRRGTIGGEILHNLLAAEFKGAVYAVNDKADVGPVAARIPVRGRHSRAGRTGGGRRARGGGRRRRARVRGRRCAGAAGRSQPVSRRPGARAPLASASCSRVCRDAGIRIVGPNCLGVLNTSVGCAAERDVRRPLAVAGGGRVHVPERRPRDRDHRGGEPPGHRALVVRLGRKQVRSVGQRLARSTGSRTRPPSSPCCTWSRSATPGSSLGSPAGSARPNRSSPSRADARPRVPARRRRIPGAMLSASDVTVDALFEQAGVIRTDTMHELFDVAALLSAQPVPRGRPGGDRHQRWRARDPVRRRLPGRRAGDRRSCPATSDAQLARVPPAGRRARQPDRHDRDRLGGRLPPHAPDAGRRRRVRRDHHDLRPAARDHGRGRRDRDSRVRARPTRPMPIAAVFMVSARRPARAAARERRAGARL